MADWRDRVKEFKNSAYRDPEELLENYSIAHDKDAGLLRDRNSGAGVFIRENGCVDIYAKEGLGISIDPNLDSISLYGSKINIYSQTLDLYSLPFCFKWNKFPLNLKPTLLGTCPAGPVTTEGTILPYNTGPMDAALYVAKILGKLVGI